MLIRIPQKLRISSLPELATRLGRPIWQAGQGGVSTIIEPEYFGTLAKISESNFWVNDCEWSESLRDHNVPELNGYNNWYLCESQMQAEDLTIYMQQRWNEAHEAERLRVIEENMGWDNCD